MVKQIFMRETNRIEFKRELTRELDIEREVVTSLTTSCVYPSHTIGLNRKTPLRKALRKALRKVLRKVYCPLFETTRVSPKENWRK